MICIPKAMADQMVRDIKSLSKMSSDERMKYLLNYMPSKEAKNVNIRIEQSILSKRLYDWVGRNLKGEQKISAISRIERMVEDVKKMENLSELQSYADGVFDSLSTKKLGISATKDDVKKLREFTDALERDRVQLSRQGIDVYDSSTILGVDEKTAKTFGDYWAKYIQMKDFIKGRSIEAENKFNKIERYGKFFTGSVFRATLLSKPSSWGLNAISAGEQILFDKAERNIAMKLEQVLNTGKLKEKAGAGFDFTKEKAQMTKVIKDLYWGESGWKPQLVGGKRPNGIDIVGGFLTDSAKISGDDFARLSGRSKASRFLNNYVDDIFMRPFGGMDNLVKAHVFPSVLEMQVNIIAKKEKWTEKKAKEIFKEAFSDFPKDPFAKEIRKMAVEQTQNVAMMEKNWMTNASKGVKDLLNKVPFVKLGDIMVPFVVGAASALKKMTIDYTPLGISNIAYKAGKIAVNGKNMSSLERRNLVFGGIVDAAKVGLGAAAAYTVASMIDDTDYIGAYDPERIEYKELRDGAYNAIRIGDTWVNLEYMPFGGMIAGIMSYRKYGKSGSEAAAEMLMTQAGMLKQIPGLEGLGTVVDSTIGSRGISEKTFSKFSDAMASYVTQGVIPFAPYLSIMSAATNEYDKNPKGWEQRFRQTFGIIPKAAGIDVTEEIPAKVNVFGEMLNERKTTGEKLLFAAKKLFFGERVKFSKEETELVKEITRLERTDNMPSLRDLSAPTIQSKSVLHYKDVMKPTEFNELEREYGTKLKDSITELITTQEYKEADDTKKKEMINGLDNALLKTLTDTPDKWKSIPKDIQYKSESTSEAIKEGKKNAELYRKILATK